MSTTFDDQREYSRFHRDPVACTVTIDGHSQAGFIVEESIGGIRVNGLQFHRLRFNEKVKIETEDQVINGFCRNLDFDESGRFGVGILCDENAGDRQQGGQLLAWFLKHNQRSFVCFPLEVGKTKCRVRLIDGKEFTLPLDSVESKTRSKRRAELSGDLAFLTTLKQLYRIKETSPPYSPDELIDVITKHEFEF